MKLIICIIAAIGEAVKLGRPDDIERLAECLVDAKAGDSHAVRWALYDVTMSALREIQEHSVLYHQKQEEFENYITVLTDASEHVPKRNNPVVALDETA